MQIASLGIAVWGAALSTFLAVVGVRREKRRLRVSFIYAIGPGDDDGRREATVTVRCINAGYRHLRVDGVHLTWEDGHTGASIRQDPFPARIDADEHLDFQAIVTDRYGGLQHVDVHWNGNKQLTERLDDEAREAMRSLVWVARAVNEGRFADRGAAEATRPDGLNMPDQSAEARPSSSSSIRDPGESV